jgi:hypothetical protein
MSQRGIGVGNGWVDRLLGELNERLIPLIVNNLLVLVKNVYAVIHNIHALVGATARSKGTLEHLQEAGVRTGGGGTTTVDSMRRSYIWKRRGVATGWSLGNSRAKRLMCHILIESFMSHCLDHAHDIGSKSTRLEKVDGYASNFIQYIVKDIKMIILHEGIKKVSLIG